MTQTSWPFEGVDTTETQYSRLLRHIGQGVNGTPGDNNLLTYADSTGMQVKVKVSGGNSQAIIRGHMYQSTAEETLVISASEANPRIDSVVLTLDPTANSIVLEVVKGTAAVSPVAPTLTQTDTAVFQLKLADVSVPASATTISAGNVTDRRLFLNNVWTSANRPTPFTGLTGYNVTVSKLETYNGTSWVEVTPTALDASVITTGTFDAARIPSLDSSKITSGTLSADRIPSLDASKVSSGTLSADRIPSLDTAKIGSGILPLARGGVGADTQAGARATIGAAAASHTHEANAIVSGTLDSNRIPTLDATKIGTGVLAVGVGGTGSSTASGARSSLGIIASNIPTTGSNVQADIDFIAGQASQAPTALTQANKARDGDLDISVWNRDVSSMTRRAAWLGNDGRILLGHTASSERFKTNFQDTGIDPLKVLEIDVVLYQNKQRLAMAEKDESIHVGLDIGMIAERLHEAGLWQFVIYERDENDELVLDKNGDAIPYGIHYELWAMAVHQAAQFIWAEQQKLSDRLSVLEELLK